MPIKQRWAVAIALGVAAVTGVVVGVPRAPFAVAGDPVVAAAGDVACAPPATRTATKCHHLATSDLLVAGGYAAVLPLGDLQYETGALADFQSVYHPSWGRVKAISHPVPGDGEYGTAGATGYFGYFGDAATPREPGCRESCDGYYAYDVGAWRVVALNSNCSSPGVGGCGASSPQGKWLTQELQEAKNRCVLAVVHRPPYKVDGTLDGPLAHFRSALYNARADVLLQASQHAYARFAPQNPAGQFDTTAGIMAFTVGTGGRSLHAFPATVDPEIRYRQNTQYGVLELTLHATSYDWRFVAESGQALDSGSRNCRA
jgi:hypothetical protein